jgi:tRNA(fMet)-specific endonuclease VapC
MNVLLDTNILMTIVRTNDREDLLSFINPNKSMLYISVVVEAEIKSLAIRNKWNKENFEKIETFLEHVQILEVSQYLVHTYVEIDTYSQRKNPSFEKYPFDTPRNMGKNDLWIASTASLLGLELVTTDTDFTHLHDVFLDVRQLDPLELKQYLN